MTGEWPYVHDFRLPGMLHARVVRPDELGARVVSLDDCRGAQGRRVRADGAQGELPRGRGQNEWAAVKAARALKVGWTPGAGLPEQSTVFEHGASARLPRSRPIRRRATRRRRLPVPRGASRRATSSPSQTHASLGPSCAVADFKDGQLTLWSASQATHSMQDELAAITRLPRESIRLVYLEGAGCYGRNGHEDAAADAALIATLIGKPVRVQWLRADETARAPKSPPRAMDFEAGLDAQGNVVAWSGDFYIALNHIAAFKPLDFPLLAATETGLPKPGNWVGFLFQNAPQPYAVPEHPGEHAPYLRNDLPLAAPAQPGAHREQLCQRVVR